MMITKKYNLINNITGWVVFAIALTTYWLTLEPTASYWDCGEFIIQADKLEVGHPPGNPIFMLTARFFSNFATDAGSISVMVNAMSGLLSALTILLLFWSITHLVRKLIVKDNDNHELSAAKYLAIMGSGVVGALAYTWSDTFWFSAVEGEVYAFSSFCTALVFWLILKWENRADNPDSDRYLILIAYIIGVSIAVHLLNLLCIPAIVLVFAYRKWNDMNLLRSLIALGISFVIIALVLFGLVPGFIKIAQWFELLFVNDFGASFNSGALFYAFFMLALLIWGIYEFKTERSWVVARIAFAVCVFFSGMLFLTSAKWVGFVLTILLIAYLFSPLCRRSMARTLNVILWSIGVIFVGYSSYALILIRSNADTPMNQNSPDNVFDLASYLSRDQYGQTPLIYGETLYSGQMKEQQKVQEETVDGEDMQYIVEYPSYKTIVKPGSPTYAKGVPGATPESEYGFLNESEKAKNAKLAARGGDYYVKSDYRPEIKYNPELNMLFPRIYSRMHASYYPVWVRLDTTPGNMKEIFALDSRSGKKVPEVDMMQQPIVNQLTGRVTYPQKIAYRPSYAQNLAYFFNYQLVHMYMRYFMWNFAGRQNDLLNQQGELDAGNWITGIPFYDNMRLGDQSLLPDELGKNNPGHNRYFMLPLILGLIGLIWQAFSGKRGVEQFWVVFFLFFMTGIAIVLYLNQPPMQPRERDYAFAGSFYAFAIWIGLGVAALWQILNMVIKTNDKTIRTIVAGVAVALGLVIPIQMVSQTWDDHDRSRRTAARDFAINYLESLEPNAIVFCNGDNDTFPLWYVQEVEGVRPDVKIINLSYLASDWYANQMRQQSYEAAPVKFTASPQNYAYGKLDVVLPGQDRAPADLLTSLKYIYSGKGRDNEYGYPMLPSSVVTVPVDKKAVVARGLIAPQDTAYLVDEIMIDLANAPSVRSKGYISLSELLMLDIIATNAAEGWPRPIYWCMTVGNEYHLGLTEYMRAVGMTHQLVPTYQEGLPARTDRGYDIVTKKYRWGGADNDKAPYYDETARRMLISTRTSMLDVATELLYEGDVLKAEGKEKEAAVKYRQALDVANLIDGKLKESTWPYSISTALTLPEVFIQTGNALGDAKVKAKGMKILEEAMRRYAKYLRYNSEITYTMGSQFGPNASLTPESRLMPYQYYRLIEIYLDNGGSRKTVEDILKTTGSDKYQPYTIASLKKNYDRYVSGYAGYSYDEEEYGDGYGEDGYTTEDDLVQELADAARRVNELAAMTPEDYAMQQQEYRLIDSIYYMAYLEYEKIVGQELLQADPDIRKVDTVRSRRLYIEYEKNNPSY